MPFITFITHPIPHHSLTSTSSDSETSSASGFSSGEEVDWHTVKSIPTEADQLDIYSPFVKLIFDN
jgi:hypothetical protein